MMGYCSCGAAYPPGLNAVGTAVLDARIKERTGVAPKIIAQSRVH